jgi:hypothetical protein
LKKELDKLEAAEREGGPSITAYDPHAETIGESEFLSIWGTDAPDQQESD